VPCTTSPAMKFRFIQAQFPCAARTAQLLERLKYSRTCNEAPLDPANQGISVIVQYIVKNNDDEKAPITGSRKRRRNQTVGWCRAASREGLTQEIPHCC
jgi:hypothetical protein